MKRSEMNVCLTAVLATKANCGQSITSHAGAAVKLAMEDPELFQNILKVFEHGSNRDREKLKMDVEYAASKI